MIGEDPSDPFCQYALGLEYAANPSTREKALEIFEALRSEHPHYLPTYYQLALLLKDEGHETRFLEVVNQGKELAASTGQQKVYAELDFLL